MLLLQLTTKIEMLEETIIYPINILDKAYLDFEREAKNHKDDVLSRIEKVVADLDLGSIPDCNDHHQ